jgi:hypothetical protein
MAKYDLELAELAELSLIGSIFLFPEFIDDIKARRLINPIEFSDYRALGSGTRARVFTAQYNCEHPDMATTLNYIIKTNQRKQEDIPFINNSRTVIESSPFDYPYYCQVIREQHMILIPKLYIEHPEMVKPPNNLNTVEL